jgi:antitoxin CptB
MTNDGNTVATTDAGGDGDSGPDRRLHWRSRRGMLELELALAPFVDRHLDRLSARDRARYARLLEHDDWDIFDWVQGKSEPLDPELAAIVAQVRAARGE